MKKEPSVLIVGNFLSATTGTRAVCEDLAERFALTGWTVVTTSSKPGRAARLLDMLHTVWNKRHQYQVACVEVYSGWAFLWAELVCEALQKLRKPYILSLHGGNLPNFARRRSGRVTKLLNSAASVTVPSGYLLEQMKPYRPDLILAPNPLDVQAYPFRSRNAPQPVIVWLRAFHELYNPRLAVRTAALLTPKFPELRLFMGGGDKGDGSLQKTEQEAASLGVSNSIEFSGKIPKAKVPGWLEQGDVFINTTNVDNTPVSVLEAMACGLCIVSTNVGGIPYLLEDGKDALLVPPDNPQAMAKAVSRILTGPGLALRLSESARQKAMQHNWARVLPLWEELLCKVAGTLQN